ncbi:ATP-binding cassette domain-containing protein [Ruminococcaceae bacterium OttesenSCG-928-L11]|nr:ATP-binding cassette domain-containing protein [Ruminococcaceae bacterium OttesenSCG-928-L11]
MLELKNLSFQVRDDNGKKEILQDVSLVIEERSFVVITGPNGGGKSTLAKLIMGIESPTSGQILFNGEDITALGPTERAARGIGFAFQQPVRFKGLAVRDLLSLAAGKTLNTEEACAYLSEVGLCALEYIDRELNASLSGGEMKRIEIAMLMAQGTSLSVFDEPEAGIDLWSFQNLIRAFEKMRDAHNRAVVIISHQERILAIADKVVVIAGGRITTTGNKEEILPSLLGNPDSCEFFRGAV